MQVTRILDQTDGSWTRPTDLFSQVKVGCCARLSLAQLKDVSWGLLVWVKTGGEEDSA